MSNVNAQRQVMTFVKLEDARQAIKPRVGEEWSRDAMEAFEYADKMLQTAARIKGRSLPTDDGWEDKALDKLDAWRFNVMLECQGGNGKCAIGGAELDLNDLLAILDFVSDQRPLPAPPSD